jgi:hypothetical protein
MINVRAAKLSTRNKIGLLALLTLLTLTGAQPMALGGRISPRPASRRIPAQGGQVGTRLYKTPGMEVCPENAKTGPIDV